MTAEPFKAWSKVDPCDVRKDTEKVAVAAKENISCAGGILEPRTKGPQDRKFWETATAKTAT